ncbi:MAG: thioredoxin family protein [Candidatus Zixiibacteriota bacterium]
MKQLPFLANLLLLLSFFALMTWADTQKESDKKKPSEKKADNEEIHWLSYDVGLEKAKANQKHIFIDFTAKWCGWCKKMDRETFSKPEIIQMINDNFIPVKVDGDSKRELNIDGYKITERNLTRYEFGVRGYPSFWFLKPDGSKLGVIRGYRTPDYMMEALTYIKERKYDSTRTETAKDGKDSKK